MMKISVPKMTRKIHNSQNLTQMENCAPKILTQRVNYLKLGNRSERMHMKMTVRIA